VHGHVALEKNVFFSPIVNAVKEIRRRVQSLPLGAKLRMGLWPLPYAKV
jgi:hypothetical protein